ncbi:MAG: DUF6089 family protein [Bacteroidota bacterium]
MRYIFCFSLFLSAFLFSPLTAQRTFSLSVGGASSYYYGDVTDKLNNALIRPGLTASGSWYLSPSVSIRLGISYGMIGAADSLAGNEARRSRNLSFQSFLGELSSVAVWHVLPDKRFGISWVRKPHISPYIFGGIGLFAFDPRTEIHGELVRLQPLGTEGQFIQNYGPSRPYRLLQASVPIGGGISVRPGKRWGIRMEAGYRFSFTDYLDDVSTVYPEPEALLRIRGAISAELSNRSGGLVGAGSQRGNPGAKDGYIFSSLVLVYYFDRFR